MITTRSRAGSYKKNVLYGTEYKSYMPKPLPPSPHIKMTKELKNLLEEAHTQIDSMEKGQVNLPDADSFVKMCLCSEAVASSYIEGIEVPLDVVLNPPEEMNPKVEATVNCVKAMEYAIDQSKESPLSNHLIKETHNILMSGESEKENLPGEFRVSQNFISGGCEPMMAIKNARYIPLAPKDIISAMNDLETYLNADDEIDPLIRAALVHYQFETIQPFLDGNGRVGRILITLFLMKRGVISSPVLCPSTIIHFHRIQYYDSLNDVKRRGDYEQWVSFFLKMIATSAENTVRQQHYHRVQNKEQGTKQ